MRKIINKKAKNKKQGLQQNEKRKIKKKTNYFKY